MTSTRRPPYTLARRSLISERISSLFIVRAHYMNDEVNKLGFAFWTISKMDLAIPIAATASSLLTDV